jgi:hypothetical protein
VLRGFEVAVVAAEVSPANEALRLSAFAAGHAVWGSALAGFLTYGGATLLIEGAAALATADLLGSRRGGSVIRWISRRLERVVPSKGPLSPGMVAATALLGGSAVLLLAKQAREPSRSRNQNLRYGLVASTLIALVCGVQGALMAHGINHPSPQTIGVAVLAIVAVYGSASWVKRRYQTRAATPAAELPLAISTEE